MIGTALILLGLVSVCLAALQLRDFRRGRSDFEPTDMTGLHPLWKTTFRIKRFNAHLDLWIFAVLGPALIVGGIMALLG